MDAWTQLIPLALQLPGFLMVLFRLGGIMVMAPFFGSAAVPVKVKIALTLTLTAALWPVLPHPVLPPASLPAIVVGVGSEMLIGLTIGLAITMLFAGLQLAGLNVGQQMGIALANVFNPDFNEQTDIVGMLYHWIGLMIFLAIGGHRMLLGAVLDSFNAVPLGTFAVTGQVVGLLTGLLTASFLMAFKIAIPTVLALFLTSVAMGLINRTVPQLNVLTAGFAIRSSLGMLIAAATIVASMKLFGAAIEHAMAALSNLMSGWVAAP